MCDDKAYTTIYQIAHIKRKELKYAYLYHHVIRVRVRSGIHQIPQVKALRKSHDGNDHPVEDEAVCPVTVRHMKLAWCTNESGKRIDAEGEEGESI